MHIEVSCRHGEIPSDVRDYIEKKAEKLLTYFERITEIDVIVDFEGTLGKGSAAEKAAHAQNGADDAKQRIRVEIEVDAEHKHDFVAHDTGDDVRTVFDATLAKMEQQIRRYKDRVQNHRRDTPMGGPAEPLHTTGD